MRRIRTMLLAILCFSGLAVAQKPVNSTEASIFRGSKPTSGSWSRIIPHLAKLLKNFPPNVTK